MRYSSLSGASYAVQPEYARVTGSFRPAHDVVKEADTGVLQAYRLVFRAPGVERGVFSAGGLGCTAPPD